MQCKVKDLMGAYYSKMEQIYEITKIKKYFVAMDGE